MVMIIVVVVDNIVHHTRSGWGYDYRNFNVCYLADGGAQLSFISGGDENVGWGQVSEVVGIN